MPCALGPGGISTDKREGDGITPAGTWPLRRVLYRPDKVDRPGTALDTAELHPDAGWCDDPEDPNYNRQVRHPYPASAERMWRGDDLYDIVVILGHNDDPVVAGAGSAIFFHIARPDYGPTEGCIAVSLPDMLTILARCGPQTVMEILA